MIRTGMPRSKSKPEETYIRAYKLAVQVIKFSRTLPFNAAVRVVAEQLIQSVSQIGIGLLDTKVSKQKVVRAVYESKFWLGLLRDSGLAKAEVVSPHLQELTEIAHGLRKNTTAPSDKKKQVSVKK